MRDVLALLLLGLVACSDDAASPSVCGELPTGRYRFVGRLVSTDCRGALARAGFDAELDGTAESLVRAVDAAEATSDEGCAYEALALPSSCDVGAQKRCTGPHDSPVVTKAIVGGEVARLRGTLTVSLDEYVQHEGRALATGWCTKTYEVTGSPRD